MKLPVFNTSRTTGSALKKSVFRTVYFLLVDFNYFIEKLGLA